MKQVVPFDGMAADYDREFTATLIGTAMRQAVWRRIDAHLRPGMRVLELNCGTGEDALYMARRGAHVLATDVSTGMIDITRAKVARAGLGGLVQTERLDMADLRFTIYDLRLGSGSGLNPIVNPKSEIVNQIDADLRLGSGLNPIVNPKSEIVNQFDAVLSNFGGLNCVADLGAVARGLAAVLRPGAPALLCVMGPLVPWEWGWYLAHGQPRKAFRRLRRGGTPWRGLTIRYPSIGALRRAFAPAFRLRRVSAVGALVPPSYAEPWAQRHPRLLAALARWEQRLASMPPLPWLADHYLAELERIGE